MIAGIGLRPLRSAYPRRREHAAAQAARDAAVGRAAGSWAVCRPWPTAISIPWPANAVARPDPGACQTGGRGIVARGLRRGDGGKSPPSRRDRGSRWLGAEVSPNPCLPPNRSLLRAMCPSGRCAGGSRARSFPRSRSAAWCAFNPLNSAGLSQDCQNHDSQHPLTESDGYNDVNVLSGIRMQYNDRSFSVTIFPIVIAGHPVSSRVTSCRLGAHPMGYQLP